jgi:NADPH-dependent glutamate synthase beta subunit-like oxidoreductase
MPRKTNPPRFAEKVAVIGAGPGGLTCAYHLAREGYKVEVFESQPVAGGMLRLAIPDYRLPREIVDKEIDFIKRAGVQINTGVSIGQEISFDQLRKEYEAVFLAVGASKSRALEIEGEDRPGVLNAIDFLRSVKLHQQEKIRIGSTVLVIGGGDTAVDSARASLRLGAREVTIVYRRDKEHMPAIADEILAAEAEGVKLETLSLPLKILGENGSASSLLCTRMKLVESDESGRPRPIPIEGSEYQIKADTIIIATGQYSDISFLPEEMAIVDGTRILANEQTCATSIPGLFAGGDVVTGPSMLIYAIASGRKAAKSIHRYLRGEEIVPVSLHPTDTAVEQLPLGVIHKSPRASPDLLDLRSRREGFGEVEQVFTDRMALDEAHRCLSCGICGDCYRGAEGGWACPWFQKMGEMERNNYCGLCMECVKSCPHDNIGLYARGFCSDTQIQGYDESWKAFIMLALALVYSVTLLGPWGTIKDWANVAETGNWKGFLTYAGIVWSTALLLIPALWLAASWLGKKLSGTEAVPLKSIFIRYSYVLVPFGLLAWIAFSFPLIMINGAYILSTLSDPLGWGWNLFGTAHIPWTPILPEYTVHIQIALLLFGLGFSLKRGYQIARTLYPDCSDAARSLIPVGVLCTAITILFLRLFTG